MEYNEKQLAIMDTAEKLFAEKGFDGTSVRDIATEAGINVAMISYYFGSKEKLMEALFEQRSAKIRLKIESLMQNEEMSHLDKVYTLIDDYVEKFFSQQEFHKIMIREQVAEKGEGILSCINDMKKRHLGSVKKLVQDGQKAGVFKKNIDIVLMMTTMVGTVNQIIASQRFYREMNHMEDMPEGEFQKHIKKKISNHLKHLFKIVLTNE